MSGTDATNVPRHEYAFLPGVFAAPQHRSLKKALDDYMQGDIVTGVGIFWATPDGEDPLTGVASSHAAGEPLPVYTWDGQAADPMKTLAPAAWPRAMSIITSQTCDITPSGPGERHHTVQVSPLERYDHRDASTQKSIERGEYVDLIAVPGAPGPGKWAANLRISVPVSKAILARQTPVHGFTDETGALAFAERVSAKYRRPALNDALSGGMTNSLRQVVGKARDAGEGWPEEIEQFRLEVAEGTRLTPVKVRIMAITLNKISTVDRQDLRKWRRSQDKSLRIDRLCRTDGRISNERGRNTSRRSSESGSESDASTRPSIKRRPTSPRGSAGLSRTISARCWPCNGTPNDFPRG